MTQRGMSPTMLAKWLVLSVVLVAALVLFIRFCEPSGGVARGSSPLFGNREDEARVKESVPRLGPANDPKVSSLGMIDPDVGSLGTIDGQGDAALGTAAAPSPPSAPAGPPSAGSYAAAVPGPPPPPGSGASQELSAQEKATLEKETGPWGEAAARLVGSTRGALFKLGEKLMAHPKILKAVLDNPLLVEGFMRQERVKRNCRDPQALRSYLSNTGDSTGIGLGLQTFKSALRTPGSAEAIFGSKLVSRVLQDCSAIGAVAGDTSAVMQIATSNPGMVSMIADPALAKSLAVNTSALGVFNQVQTSQGSPPR